MYERGKERLSRGDSMKRLSTDRLTFALKARDALLRTLFPVFAFAFSQALKRKYFWYVANTRITHGKRAEVALKECLSKFGELPLEFGTHYFDAKNVRNFKIPNQRLSYTNKCEFHVEISPTNENSAASVSVVSERCSMCAIFKGELV